MAAQVLDPIVLDPTLLFDNVVDRGGHSRGGALAVTLQIGKYVRGLADGKSPEPPLMVAEEGARCSRLQDVADAASKK